MDPQRQDHFNLRKHHFTPSIMQEVIKSCLECYESCLETLQYCIQQGGDHVASHHLKLMQISAELSRTCANLMMLQSPYHKNVCDLCARVCRECAKSCAELQDEAMLTCSQICLDCAAKCQSIG